MRKLFAVLKREYLQAVRKKMFIFMTLFFPVLMAGLMFIPIVLMSKALGEKHVAVSELNGCEYTLSTALALGRREGLTEDDFDRARRGEAGDTKTATALRFARTKEFAPNLVVGDFRNDQLGALI